MNFHLFHHVSLPAVWTRFTRACNNSFLDALAAILLVIGVHYITNDVTWRDVLGVAFLALSMILIKWRCGPS